MVGLSIALGLLVATTIKAVPLETRDNGDIELESGVNEKMEILVAEFRESTVLPLILNPLQITKLTCGSLFTFYDVSTSNLTVSVDVCLVSLLLAKLLVVVPVIIEQLEITEEGGLFNILDNIANNIQKRLDLAGTGPEGEPFGLDYDAEQKKSEGGQTKPDDTESSSPSVSPLMSMFSSLTSLVDSFTKQATPAAPTAVTADSSPTSTAPSSPTVTAAGYNSQQLPASWSSGFDTYTGFGFDGWQSGIQRLGQLAMNGAVEWEQEMSTDEGVYDYLPRGFSNSVVKVEEVLIQTIRQLNTAVRIEQSTH